MKKVLKTVSLAIIWFATIGLIYYEESITAFAKNYNFLNIREGQIIENGDILEWEGTLKEHMIDKNISSENIDNIQINNLTYENEFENIKYENLADTVNKPETKEVVEPEENPYTGSIMNLFVLFIVMGIFFTNYYFKKKIIESNDSIILFLLFLNYFYLNQKY